jgi:SMC interacting uncharacterized protein involved in chromosome segregation
MTDDLVERLRNKYASPQDAVEAASRIEKLEAALDKAAFSQTLFDAVVDQRNKANDRINELEAALREIDIACDYSGSEYVCRDISRKALEGKDD